ncbi:MAG: hypothetical protein K0S39_1895 [Paenibacillus sp.]|nr:hypothetical protein [Paenibacillus sp.]
MENRGCVNLLFEVFLSLNDEPVITPVLIYLLPNAAVTRISLIFQPLTEPSITPFVKCFCRNG